MKIRRVASIGKPEGKGRAVQRRELGVFKGFGNYSGIMMKERDIPQPQVVLDTEYAFQGYWDAKPEGKCRVRLIEKNGAPPVLLITELPDNPSTSVTNIMEHLAPEIIRTFLPQAFEELELPTIIEHYEAQRDIEETFDLVTFAHAAPRKVWLGGRERISLGEPHWKRLPLEEAKALLGEIDG